MIPIAKTTPPYWQQPAFGVPVLIGERHADVCVIGLGGSGLSAVHALLDVGHSVIGIDAGGIAQGAAGRNGGFLLAGVAAFYHDACEQYGRDCALGLYRITQQQLERMAEETPEAVNLNFSIRRAADEAELDDCRAELAAFERDDIEADWYEGPEGAGIKVYRDGVFHPQQRALTRARHALERGAELYLHSPALEVSGDTVRTPEGIVRCRAVIAAVDGGLVRLFPELNGRVYDVRLQMLATAPDPNLKMAGPVYSRFGNDYWQQRPDGQILLGGGRDLAGTAEFCHNADVTEFVQDYLTTVLRRDIGTDAPITHRWAGIVGYSDDKLPVLEEVRPSVIAVGGYSGTGNVLGAAAARDAAAWVSDQPTPLKDVLTQIKRKSAFKAAS